MPSAQNPDEHGNPGPVGLWGQVGGNMGTEWGHSHTQYSPALPCSKPTGPGFLRRDSFPPGATNPGPAAALDGVGTMRAIIKSTRKGRCLKTPHAKRHASPTVRLCHVRTLAAPAVGAANGCGWDGATRKAARTSLRVFSTSRPPLMREDMAGGFKSRKGA